MADDVLLNKAASIERCLNRIDEEYRGHEQEFEINFTRQDALMLNLLRASETAIDAAMHLVRVRKLGLPQESRDAFRMLAQAGILLPELSVQLQKMVGFRNIAIHNYAQLDLNIVRSIVEQRLGDFREFARLLIRLA
ncbi:MAG TPA: DUF86 domain-containing protein [Burkholderiales bacterium]